LKNVATKYNNTFLRNCSFLFGPFHWLLPVHGQHVDWENVAEKSSVGKLWTCGLQLAACAALLSTFDIAVVVTFVHVGVVCHVTAFMLCRSGLLRVSVVPVSSCAVQERRSQCSTSFVRFINMWNCSTSFIHFRWRYATVAERRCGLTLYGHITTAEQRTIIQCTAVQWLVHWPLMGGLLHLVQRGGDCVGWGPSSPLLAVPNVTAHPSMASVSMNVLRCTTVNWCKASCAVFFHHVAVFSCHGCERFLTVSVSAEWHMRSLFLSAAAFNCIYWDKYCLWAGCWLLSTRHISRQRTGFHSFFISSFGN